MAPSFKAPRVRELELRVDDGDDAPLELGAVSGRLRVPDLFLAAQPGDYALLLGQNAANAERSAYAAWRRSPRMASAGTRVDIPL